MLCAVEEVVEICVEGRRVVALEHVVPFLLEPVERLLRTPGAVAEVGLGPIVVRVGAAAAGDLRLSESDVGRCTGHVAAEAVHVVLFATTVRRMNPKPRADATALRTGRHPSRDLEVREAVPHAGLVDTEDGEVLWLDVGDVRLVCDRECASLEIVKTSGVVLRRRRAGTRVVAILDVSSRVGGEEGGGALVAGDLRRHRPACGQLEDVTVIRRVVEMTMEPPLIEGVFCQRGDGPVVIRESLHCNVEPPHGRVEERCMAGH